MSLPAQISPEELHLLYILLDSNLPTGGFVSSSGLESYVKHGFLGLPSSSTSTTTTTSNQISSSIYSEGNVFTAVKGTKDVIRGVTDFAEAEVGHYANTTGCFVRDAWSIVDSFLASNEDPSDTRVDEGLRMVLRKIEILDGYHESTLLSHVARRASKAQGVAMLTLFGRGLSRPVGFEAEYQRASSYQTQELGREQEVEPRAKAGEGEGEDEEEDEDLQGVKEKRSKDLIDAYKLLVRKGSVPGHLAVCWGIITAALGLALGESQPTLFSLTSHLLLCRVPRCEWN